MMSWPVEKLSTTRNDKWYMIHKDNMYLKLHFDQLFLLSNDLILESFNLKHFIKGFIKDNVLILVYQDEDKFNKLKLKFSCEEKELEELLTILEMCFPIHKYNKTNDSLDGITINNFQQLVQIEMQRQSTAANIGIMFPENFPLDQFIKTCLLDPDFPKLVDGIQDIIKHNLK